MPEECNTPEEWRPIPGWEGFYEVSDQGRVRGVDRVHYRTDKHGSPYPVRIAGRVRRAAVCAPYWYPLVGLSRPGHRATVAVHRAVASAFIGPRPPGCDVCHIDGDRSNSRLSNLRYDTRRGNHADKVAHGTQPRGVQIHCHKLTPDSVREIRASRDSAASLAHRYGVCRTTITNCIQGKTWKHVEEQP